MKVRKHSKRRFASAMSKGQGRNLWSQAERDAFAALLNGLSGARFLKRKPLKYEEKPGATVTWRPRRYIDKLTAAASFLDAQPVQAEGRMLWDGQKMHGGPT